MLMRTVPTSGNFTVYSVVARARSAEISAFRRDISSEGRDFVFPVRARRATARVHLPLISSSSDADVPPPTGP